MSLPSQIAVDGLAVGLADARNISLHEGAPFAERRGRRRCRIFALQPCSMADNRPSAFCTPAGGITAEYELDTEARKCIGFQPSSAVRLIAMVGEFRRGELDEDVGAGGLELGDLGVDAGVRHLVRRLGHDRNLAAEAILQALDVVLAEAVVLIEDRDLAARMVLQQILRNRCGLRSGSSAGSRWSRETRAAGPTSSRPRRRRAAGSFSRSDRGGRPGSCWCRGSPG